jgi:hypothetical protein
MKKTDTTPPQTSRRGRESGTLVPGSLPWQLSKLAVGGPSLLVDDAPNRAQQLGVAVARYEAAHGGEFITQVCAGVALQFDGRSAFRFYRVTRVV